MQPDPNVTPRERPWDQVSWWYSAILVVPAIMLLLMLVSGGGPQGSISGDVRDALTGKGISGAVVQGNTATAVSEGDGRFAFDDPDAVQLVVRHDGYADAQLQLPESTSNLSIDLLPLSIEGTVKSVSGGQGLAGITVNVVAANGTQIQSATTDADGHYILTNIPLGSTINVIYEKSTVASVKVERGMAFDFSIRRDVLTGSVVDDANRPVVGAKVAVGTTSTLTEADGQFRLAGVPDSGTVTVTKPGYVGFSDQMPDSLQMAVVLQPMRVNALYAPPAVVNSDARWAELMSVIDQTDANAVVIDVKDSSGHLLYASNVALAQEIGAVPTADAVTTRLADLKSKDIHAIARLVVFEDPLLAEAREALAIHDLYNPGPWRTWDGRAWVNPHLPEVWAYNAAVAQEVVALGFDEVQLDYVRFPSDGMLENADYGSAHQAEPRVEAIGKFLDAVQTALGDSPALLGVTVEGLQVLEDNDGGIGQQMTAMAPFVDVISPTLYPSTFYPGVMGFDIPGNHPYDVVFQSLQLAADMLPGSEGKLRPWLQGFSFGEATAYTDAEMRAEISAVHAYGGNGWMLWVPDGRYSVSAIAAP